MRFNLAVIGTGYMAHKHCAALAEHPRAQLATVCGTERSHLTAEELKSRYGFARATADYSSVLSDPETDIVFICSPDSFHAQQVCAALKAGKHVFCEKPLARTEKEFRDIARALEKSKNVLQVGMNCRFREQYSRARDLIVSGDLGELRFLRGTYIVNVVGAVHRQEKPWWPDCPEGVFPFLHGGAIHCLDLLRWIGGEVDSVFARATDFELGSQLKADTFSISFSFAGGAIGELLVAAGAFTPNDFSLEMWLSRGSIVGSKIFRRTDDSVSASPEQIQVEQKIIDLGLQFSDLVRAIKTKTCPLNSFAEAEKNFKVLQAIEASVHAGNPVSVIK